MNALQVDADSRDRLLFLHRAYWLRDQAGVTNWCRRKPPQARPSPHSPASSRALAFPPRRRRCLVALFTSAALLFALDAGWIHAKALLAQQLLQRAWSQTLVDGERHRPWPWSEAEPVARLRVPRLGIDQVVLNQDSGRALAFGPGWSPASARLGGVGTSVISGHRDTHFAWLRELRSGDRLSLQTTDGSRAYEVVTAEVADATRQRIEVDTPDDRMLLVTCFPFDALLAGGPLRYVVSLRPVGSTLSTAIRP